MRVLFWTLRKEYRASSPLSNPYVESGPERFFYSVWHDSMVIPAFGGKQIYSAALTSRHQDGTFVTAVLRSVGMPTVRGSTSRGGAEAIRLICSSFQDHHIVITPDGPRGPRREMSLGIIFLASRTGRGIIPTAYSCSRCWSIKGGWTDLIIPKPFAKVYFLAGDPIHVPDELSKQELQPYSDLVQAQMDELEAQAQRLVHPEMD